ncbi:MULTISPECIES: family 43 glycosylhydrolase [Asticcacaulis]|uniref:family 43 glycosylhydrolase n=1 Tax=Asticcacaulis TaxID=76890 RepID=UPI001AE80FA2|nr:MULTISPECIES: family 43 glycosylhydrolase [Asticcacaulis]MBP2159301.1 beta-xylosidase [Asticcacaulis solisilvae]MDR6800346.1 beta-xylosidase [Asticcacaulis sp. BE141]
MSANRRDALKTFSLGALLFGAPAAAEAAAKPAAAKTPVTWAKGIEGQRKADLDNGTFLNPVMAGDHPDPSILKDGEDYYMTFSTFDAYPGLIIWHSKDLVNWQPVGPTLTRNIGSVWAPELCKHNGRYFLYIPTKKTSAPGSKTTSWVIWADNIKGPWSDPIDLDLPAHIDPGHAVGEDGSRWLFLSGGDRVRLSDDGLARIGEPQHVYDPWRYPDDWDVEGFAPEGPKVTRHGGYYYLILAVGGTAGPPTGHMVIAARSKSINGPWENHPRNPLVRTTSLDEKWWSRGHATLVEGPAGDWWGVYHGYENGFWTLGRQTLLAPVTWSKDGWFDFGGGDLSKPIAKPKGGKPHGGDLAHGMALSDDFSADKYGIQWNFFNPAADEATRIRREGGVLHLKAKGEAPSSSAVLTTVVGDQAYEIEMEIEIDEGARAGLLLFYDQKLYCGLGFDKDRFITHQYGIERGRPANPNGKRMLMRLKNDRHIVSFHTSTDGQTWKRFDRGMEVSGYHHNVRGGFLMLKPAFYATGTGEARFKNFKYKAL